MKTGNLLTSLFLIVIIITGPSCKRTEDNLPVQPVPIALSVSQTGLINSSNSFAFDLFKKVNTSSGQEDNIIISPLSVSIALSMTLNGAEGATRDSMLKALRLEGITPESVNNAYKELTKALLSVDKRVLISIANSVWTENDFVVKQTFIDILKNYYGAESGSFDIHDASAPDRINSWIEEKTNNLIKKMISKLDDNTVMLLVNAIYFKGKWRLEFDASKTADMPFYRLDGTSTSVAMMKQTDNFRAYRGEGFTLAELPYGQGNYAMDVIIADEGKGIDELISGLDDAGFNTWISKLSDQKVDISFPRFKYSFRKELKDLLTDMGMGIAFTDQADLSGISDTYDLLISFVTHQAYIETNEEGTEAAAATVVGVGVTSYPQNLILNLNHPFFYIIRETTTNSVVFMGKIEDPSLN